MHTLAFLSEGLRPHEALCEAALERVLLVVWKVLLFHHLVQRLGVWSPFPHEQSLRGKGNIKWLGPKNKIKRGTFKTRETRVW